MSDFYDYDVYALVDDANTVINIIVGPKIENGLTEQEATEKLTSMHGGKWLLTANTSEQEDTNKYRKNYAVVGGSYNPEIDAFVAHQPYPSWVLNKEIADWEAPTPTPVEGEWYWDEETTSWVAVQQPE